MDPTPTPAAPPQPEPTPTPAPAPEPTPAPTPSPEPTPAPAPEPAPPPAALIGPDGKFAENWFLQLGDDFAPHADDLKKFTNIRDFVTSYKYFQKGGVEYPGDAAPAQAIERFRKVAGVPETPDGYGLTAENVKLPEGMTFDAELATAVAQAAHKTHTPPAAVAAIVGTFNELLAKRTAEAQSAQLAEQKAAQDDLVKAWGGNFQLNASTVRHLTGKLADLAGVMPDDPAIATLANTPTFAKIMLTVANLTSEDRIATPAHFTDLKSPAQRIEEITSGRDPVWGRKYREGTTQERQEAYAFVSSLRAQAAG